MVSSLKWVLTRWCCPACSGRRRWPRCWVWSVLARGYVSLCCSKCTALADSRCLHCLSRDFSLVVSSPWGLKNLETHLKNLEPIWKTLKNNLEKKPWKTLKNLKTHSKKPWKTFKHLRKTFKNLKTRRKHTQTPCFGYPTGCKPQGKKALSKDPKPWPESVRFAGFKGHSSDSSCFAGFRGCSPGPVVVCQSGKKKVESDENP